MNSLVTLKPGERKRILLERDQFLQDEMSRDGCAFENVSHSSREKTYTTRDMTKLSQEVIRPFGKMVDVIFSYKANAIVDVCMGGPDNMITPVHHFKDLDLTKNANIKQFGVETIKFASACLNGRTNGTLHFGITSSTSDDVVPGQIVGTGVFDEKSKYANYIDRCVTECFYPDQRDIVRSCVRPPKFIPVLSTHGAERSLYVIEIDVEPASELCGNEAFYAKIPWKKEKGILLYQDAMVFMFREGMVKPLCSDELHAYMSTSKPKLTQQRKIQEGRRPKSCNTEHLRDKLIDLLCEGEQRLTGGRYPILVINQPAEHMDRQYLEANFRFLECIPWRAVFDFDNSAAVCNYMRDVRERNVCIINSADELNSRSPENVADPERLERNQDDMRNPVHVPWIFANGYAALATVEESMDPIKWRKLRREGFKEAVRFLADELPPQRSIVVFLLAVKRLGSDA